MLKNHDDTITIAGVMSGEQRQLALSVNNGDNFSSDIKSEGRKKCTRSTSHSDIEVVEPTSVQDASRKAAGEIVISKIKCLRSTKMNDKIKSQVIRIGMNGFTVTERFLVMRTRQHTTIAGPKKHLNEITVAEFASTERIQQLAGVPSQGDKMDIPKWSTQRVDAAEMASTIQQSIDQDDLKFAIMLKQCKAHV